MSEPLPEFGGCVWPLDPACLGETWEMHPESVRTRAAALASASLERLTAYRVGNCPITVRPVPNRGRCFIPSRGWEYGQPFLPGVSASGEWQNNCGWGCEPDMPCGITLPGPVGRIDTVMVDGAEVDPADYTLYDTTLVWVGAGDCPFPGVQDLTLPDTEPGTMSVTYLNAYPVDSLGAYAAGLLASEFAKACTGNKCRLPSNVVSVARQGITFDVVAGIFPDGQTGIREIDAYIGLWNPGGRRQGTQVWYPGMSQPKVVR